MVINGKELLRRSPIENMESSKIIHESGLSYGLTETGYDIRIAEDIYLSNWDGFRNADRDMSFLLASSIEKFQMPNDLVGYVFGKSTNLRKGIRVMESKIEPGWFGYLTLEIELIKNDDYYVNIKKGTPIAAIDFHQLWEPAAYGDGKYQNQPPRPVEAILQI